jgi:hypothetical protein
MAEKKENRKSGKTGDAGAEHTSCFSHVNSNRLKITHNDCGVDRLLVEFHKTQASSEAGDVPDAAQKFLVHHGKLGIGSVLEN